MSSDLLKKQRKKKARRERQLKGKIASQRQERMYWLMQDASAAHQRMDWEQAAHLCRRGLEMFPNHEQALRIYVDALRELGRNELLAPVFGRLCALHPHDAQLHYQCFMWAMEKRQWGAAKEALAWFRDGTHARFIPKKNRDTFAILIEQELEKDAKMAALRRVSLKPATAVRTHAGAASKPAAAAGGAALERIQPELQVRIDDVKIETQDCCGNGGGADAWFWVRQRLRREHLRMQAEFEELLCIPRLRGVEHFTYQIETVRKVLRVFRGRVLLADEVGLGKTIEAGMALKEYLLRGMVRSALVLCPPSLVHQWAVELRTKFDIRAYPQNLASASGKGDALWSRDIVVASIHTAKSRANFASVTGREWDMVIVDEAHHLKSRSTLSWKLVNEIRKKFLLLLSATPVQNNLVELYNLISLLKPGAFPPEKEFVKTYCERGNARAARNSDALRLLMRDVMVRNTRAGCGAPFPRRYAATFRVAFSEAEAGLYERIGEAVREAPGLTTPHIRMAVRHVLERAGAHLPGALTPLRRLGDAVRNAGDEARAAAMEAIAEEIANLPRSTEKTARLLALLAERKSQAIVFCRHTSTVGYLSGEFLVAGMPYASFHGGMPQEERQRAIESFRNGEALTLISSESGGEGQNLQFCNTIVNFDLPWNPMQIEQRIGRVHRIGQANDVFVFNFCYRDTIEEKILTILEDKIRMFELVVGEVDSILGNLDERGGFSGVVLDLWLAGRSAQERAEAFERLGDELKRSGEEYREAVELDARGAAIRAEYLKKADDLRLKYLTRVQVEQVGLLCVRLPCAVAIFTVMMGMNRREIMLPWNPLTRRADAVQCEECGAAIGQARLCRELHWLCERCRRVCSQCKREYCPRCKPKGCVH